MTKQFWIAQKQKSQMQCFTQTLNGVCIVSSQVKLQLTKSSMSKMLLSHSAKSGYIPAISVYTDHKFISHKSKMYNR